MLAGAHTFAHIKEKRSVERLIIYLRKSGNPSAAAPYLTARWRHVCAACQLPWKQSGTEETRRVQIEDVMQRRVLDESRRVRDLNTALRNRNRFSESFGKVLTLGEARGSTIESVTRPDRVRRFMRINTSHDSNQLRKNARGRSRDGRRSSRCERDRAELQPSLDASRG
ncbi:hypothetical protein Baya_7860 [Bagarius yarrelli]|uniref:Uncharacterized protein n=1 Tax=Bagarius yarrelli TaxID=175774 RepID=A0A556U316_BAGYA|nr:hypothetical protein Baya_7860 [Bagarius yarrelli]